MATHSSILAWKILWTEEPGRLQSMRLQRDMSEHAHMSQFSCTAFSPAAVSGGHILVVVHGLLIAMASLVVEHRL